MLGAASSDARGAQQGLDKPFVFVGLATWGFRNSGLTVTSWLVYCTPEILCVFPPILNRPEGPGSKCEAGGPKQLRSFAAGTGSGLGDLDKWGGELHI